MRVEEGGAPRLRIPPQARRARITGSHVYRFLACEHAVWLDFFGDPGCKLPPSRTLQRLLDGGVAHEAAIVAELGYPEPAYERDDFDTGAARTEGLLRRGVDGVSQGVLWDPPFLGIPDLLRREPGASALGEWHYVVGDIKSSRRPRADQALQVAFYSRLLGKLQDRHPEHGFLVMQDGSEERIDTVALAPVLDEVLEEMAELLAARRTSTPHVSVHCRECAWRAACDQEPDVHRVPGLTRSVRGMLDREGYRELDALMAVEPRRQAGKGLLPEATWQRARWGAQALREQRALRVRDPRLHEIQTPLASLVILHDPRTGRLPVFAARLPGAPPLVVPALGPAAEERAAREVLRALARAGSAGHGDGLPGRLYELMQRMPADTPQLLQLEARAVNVMSIVRGAWVFPAPVRSPAEALAWIRGEPPAEAGSWLGLHLAAEDTASLEAIARAELDALDELSSSLLQGS